MNRVGKFRWAICALLFAAFFYLASIGIALTFGLWVILLFPSKALSFSRAWSLTMVALSERIVGLRLEVTGLQHVPKTGPALIASQHRSAFDTMIWFRYVDRPAYVMKTELFRIPIFGAIARLAGMIGVDRSGGGNAMRAMLAAARAAAKDGRQVIIFPEGTRVRPGQHVPIQPGIVALAAATGLPVIPVATNTGTVWGRGLFAKQGGVVQLAVGAPIPAGLRREELLGRIEDAWAQLERDCGIVPPSTSAAA